MYQIRYFIKNKQANKLSKYIALELSIYSYVGDSKVNITRQPEIKVRFNVPVVNVDKNSVKLLTTAGGEVPITEFTSSDGKLWEFSPLRELDSDAGYKITISASIISKLDGTPLAIDEHYKFTTENSSPCQDYFKKILTIYSS